MLVEGYEGLLKRRAKILEASKRELTAAAGRIVSLFDAWGKADQAAAWRVKVEALATKDQPKS